MVIRQHQHILLLSYACLLKCSLCVWPFANRLLLALSALSAMAKARASSAEIVEVELKLAKFQIICPQCNRPIIRQFDPSRWGAEQDYDLRNRLSQHTWSSVEHAHMEMSDCDEQVITVWDINKENEFEYMDPRHQTSVTTVTPEPSASSHKVPPNKTKEWMEKVIERLDRMEKKVDSVQDMLRSSVTKPRSRSRSPGRPWHGEKRF